jgi:hypothetical protein
MTFTPFIDDGERFEPIYFSFPQCVPLNLTGRRKHTGNVGPLVQRPVSGKQFCKSNDCSQPLFKDVHKGWQLVYTTARYLVVQPIALQKPFMAFGKVPKPACRFLR